MVMCAELIVIGPFKQELTQHYEYPPDRYAGTKAGTPVVRRLFGIVEGTRAGVAFAAALGIRDPWDFNQHKVTASEIDFAALRAELAPLEDGEQHLRDIDALQAFAAEGYDIYFLPNG